MSFYTTLISTALVMANTFSAPPIQSKNYCASYKFSVCSGAGGAHGVDFRSHFAVYGAQHGISGWVRNACDNCVYGEFSGDCDAASQLYIIMSSPDLIVTKLASKAHNVTTTVTKTTSYPDEECDGGSEIPLVYMTAPNVQVDWSFAQNCSSACDCRPTGYWDCQQTTPLPAGASFTKDCQRAPLGLSTKNFADCNSVHVDVQGTNCYSIDAGEIVDSGKCPSGWIEKSFAAQCCGPVDPKEPNGRTGRAIPPAPTDCSAFTSDDAYLNKCPKLGTDRRLTADVHYVHPFDSHTNPKVAP